MPKSNRTRSTTIQLFVICLICVLFSIKIEAQEPSDVVRPMKVANDPRHGYYSDLLKEAMEITRPTYGNYTWEVWVKASSAKRHRILLQAAEVVNVVYSPPGNPYLKDITIPVVHPIRKGLNGTRVLLVRRDRLSEFEHIKTIKQLKTKVAGQGRGWSDVAVYRHNGLPVLASGTFNHLFSMLLARRFDYYPLGVAEAPIILKACGSECSDVAVVPDLLIKYKFPIYFHVALGHERLARRIAAGLTLLEENGSFDVLWSKYHSDYLRGIDMENSTIIRLENPMLKADEKQGH